MFNRLNKATQAPEIPVIPAKPVNTQPATQSLTLTVEQVADELHVSRPTAYNLVEQKDFPSFRIGTRILVSRKGLEEWIDKQIMRRNEEK